MIINKQKFIDRCMGSFFLVVFIVAIWATALTIKYTDEEEACCYNEGYNSGLQQEPMYYNLSYTEGWRREAWNKGYIKGIKEVKQK